MPSYRFTIESKDDMKVVKIDGAAGLRSAQQAMRDLFPFERWRIVNIAEVLADR